jgi:hypothetical protein
MSRLFSRFRKVNAADHSLGTREVLPEVHGEKVAVRVCEAKVWRCDLSASEGSWLKLCAARNYPRFEHLH